MRVGFSPKSLSFAAFSFEVEKNERKKNSPVSVGVVLETFQNPADLVPHVVQGRVGETGRDDDRVVVQPDDFFEI